MFDRTYYKKVWITKGALTARGIYTFENAEQMDNFPNMIKVKQGGYDVHYHKPDWHLTEEEALVEARKMVKKEIAKLEKKIGILKNKKY